MQTKSQTNYNDLAASHNEWHLRFLSELKNVSYKMRYLYWSFQMLMSSEPGDLIFLHWSNNKARDVVMIFTNSCSSASLKGVGGKREVMLHVVFFFFIIDQSREREKKSKTTKMSKDIILHNNSPLLRATATSQHPKTNWKKLCYTNNI